MLSLAQQALRTHLLPRRHTALLVAIVASFAVRPLIGDSGIAQIAFSLSILGLMLIALYTVQVDEVARRTRRAAVPSGEGGAAWDGCSRCLRSSSALALIFTPNSRRLLLVGSISWLIFFAFVTWTELRSVLRQREITGETISMSISVYLLFALTWGLLYSVIYQIQPNAFSITALSGRANSSPRSSTSA